MTDPLRHTFETILGLPHDYLRQQGDWSVQYNPAWPGQSFIGAPVWNIVLVAVALLLVAYVYTRDGRSRTVRIVLGAMRALLLGLIILLLNRPVLTLGQTWTQPSVLAVMVDDSGSMCVPDAGGNGSAPLTRLAAVQSVFTREQGKLLKDLSEKHNIKFYRFDRDAQELANVQPTPVAFKPVSDLSTVLSPSQQMYSRFSRLVLPGAVVYFAALVVLLLASGNHNRMLWSAGLGLFAIAIAIHTTGIILRWTHMHSGLATSDVGHIIFSPTFGAIACIAWIIVVAGLLGELLLRRSVIGAAGGLIGALTLLALFGMPFLLASEPDRVQVASSRDLNPAMTAIGQLQPVGQSTQVLPSILTVLHDLQGQRVAGVVVITDGRDTPARNLSQGLDQLKNYGAKVYPVAVGSDQQPKNIQVQNMQLDDVAFKGDIVNVKAMVHATGYEPNHPVHVVLRDKKTGEILPGAEGPAEKNITLPDDKPVEVELQWKTSTIGTREVVFEATEQPGELDKQDNTVDALVSVLDAKITVLFVDGYPRWDYRYLKTFLIREKSIIDSAPTPGGAPVQTADKSIDVSCLLASADFNFLQEGTKPLPSSGKNVAGHFPDTIDQMMEYDVIVFGDVDPRYFSDAQLQLVNEFVNRGGGFEMVAGERFSPQAYRNTPIEPLLPVSLAQVEPTDPNVPITQGFRPAVTKSGDSTSIFRFFADKDKNEDFLKHQLPEVFWYCRGITAKPSVGEVLAEHPTDLGPDKHKAPILVAGRFGGRTLFSAMDDSWRWRFYNDESVFDTYWIQQLRYLARNRKIGQRRLTLTADQQVYELGQQVRLTLRVIDPGLVRQLPDQIRVQETDANGQPVRMENLVRQDGSGGETFAGSFTADKVGKFTIHLPPIVSGVDAMDAPLEVSLPRLELNDPRVDRVQLSRLATETLGKSLDLGNAEAELAAIPSAKKDLPRPSAEPLWNSPLVLVVFMLLIGTEWVLRKVYGMV